MPDVELVSGPRSLGRSVILHIHTIGPVALARMLVHPGHKLITAHITPASFLGSIRYAQLLLGLVGRYMRFVYNRADSILAVSEATAAELAALKVTRPITVSYNAIDDQPIRVLSSRRDELRDAFGWRDQLVVLAVGQLQPRKGVAEFLACAAALPWLRFIWVGGMQFGLLSAEREKLRRICSKAPNNVSFLGMMPRMDAFQYYVAADVFFLPSRQESFGLATLEAATAGLPLVLGNLGCYREWLDEAYLSGTSTEEYVELLRRLGNPQLRAALGERAAQVASLHGGQALITSLRDAYQSVARQRRTR